MDGYSEKFEQQTPLPDVNISSLEAIERMITSSIPSLIRKTKVINQVLSNDVIRVNIV